MQSLRLIESDLNDILHHHNVVSDTNQWIDRSIDRSHNHLIQHKCNMSRSMKNESVYDHASTINPTCHLKRNTSCAPFATTCDEKSKQCSDPLPCTVIKTKHVKTNTTLRWVHNVSIFWISSACEGGWGASSYKTTKSFFWSDICHLL